jgi:GT2 family glycosyltransferase
MMDLSIALVNWNNRDYLEQCLRSIMAAELPVTYEIVVADHGSTDGSREMLRTQFPQVKVVANDENLGVARGNNQCIQNSTGRCIYILNNDTLVNRESILRMVRFLEEHAEAGAVGGNLLNPDGTLQASFCYFPTLWEEFQVVTHIGQKRNPVFPCHPTAGSETREVDWLSSASILVRREAIEEIGLIDEEYFIYSDETDWQYRLWQAGWKVFYIPEVTTIHFGGGSFKPGDRRYALVYRGRMLFARKHYGWAYSIAQRSLFALAAIGREIVWLVLLANRKWRAVSRKQLVSNWQTLRYCLQLK